MWMIEVRKGNSAAPHILEPRFREEDRSSAVAAARTLLPTYQVYLLQLNGRGVVVDRTQITQDSP